MRAHKLMSEHYWKGHEFWRFVTGISKHDALIACAGFVAIDAECDLGGLSGNRLDDLQAFNRQAPSRIVVTDADQDIFGDFWGIDTRSGGDFPKEKKCVVFDRGLDRHT